MFHELLKEISKKEIVITYENGKLQYGGPEQYINNGFLAKLKKYKHKLIKYYWPSDCPNMMPINTEGNKIPFILLHAGEANYSISEYLGKDQPFYGFFYLGSEGEKIKYKNVKSFAEAYLHQLRRIVPDGPYVLGGFSFGGVLAYEMAVKLQKEGQKIPVLILVDSTIPSIMIQNKTNQKQKEILNNLYNYIKDLYYYGLYNIRNFSYELFHMVNLTLPVKWRNSYIIYRYSKLAKKYKPNEIFQGYTLLFKTEDNESKSKYLGWDKLCINIHMENIKGNHQSMYRSNESIKLLRERINKLLEKVNYEDLDD